jgi:hypothetical protein
MESGRKWPCMMSQRVLRRSAAMDSPSGGVADENGGVEDLVAQAG